MLYLRFGEVSVWNMEWRREILCLVGVRLVYPLTRFLCAVLQLVQPSVLTPLGCVCFVSFSLEIAAQRCTTSGRQPRNDMAAFPTTDVTASYSITTRSLLAGYSATTNF